MSVAHNAVEAIDKGVSTVETVANWFADNRENLPIGLAVAGGIVAVMLALIGLSTLKLR